MIILTFILLIMAGLVFGLAMYLIGRGSLSRSNTSPVGAVVLGWPVKFKKGEDIHIIMPSISVRTTDVPIKGTVTFLDAKGNATAPEAIPVWSVTDSAILSLVTESDGLTAHITPVGIGTASVSVVTTNLDGSVVSATGDVTVTAGAPATATLDLTPGA